MSESIVEMAGFEHAPVTADLRDSASTRAEPEARAAVAGQGEASAAWLVKMAAAGDSRSWDRLVDMYAGTVWAIARAHRLNAADAADVSQTTWLRLVENLERIQQPERVGAWLATTARRESLRVLRLSGRQIPTGADLELVPDDGAEPPDSDGRASAREAERILSDLVLQLPERSRVLLRLLSADTPLSYKEISEALDMPIGSIGPTRARALEQLRRLAVKSGVNPDDIFC